ncbi:calcium-binding protein [Nostoc sp. ChiQUE01b]|uniref:calcium-binding protein n=1 Tax=Nostoc sp. ChiQUE01b TaxID=3075376 RepID=UPI002AD2510A|nr:calcium-binding protein [Nostoc sp. ChiQUE01b]MDZ8260062.1 calcium-binding protein [Nostoc sp. ChiQUE01b]
MGTYTGNNFNNNFTADDDGQSWLLSGKGGDDYLAGKSQNDTIYGDEGNDNLFGGAGNDSLYGGIGFDTLNGGDGNDRIFDTDGIVDGGAGADTLIADYSKFDNGFGVEVAFQRQNAIFSRLTGNPVLNYSNIERFEITGTQYGDVLRGAAGNDILNGGAGDDTLIGGAGYDTLNGGDGNDRITDTDGIVNGGAGTDTLVADYSKFDNGFGVEVAFQRQNAIFSRLNGDNPVLNYSNIERFEITGTKYNDVLRGTAGDDILNGGAGDDLLFGSPGNDTFNGGAGTDTLIADYSQFNNGAGVVQNQNAILSSFTGKSVLNFSNIERFEITGTQYSDVLRGAADIDILNGGAGDDALFGGAGNDLLVGGAGNDILTGGTGADQFVFNSKVEGLDVIKDFNWVEGDKIQISKIGFGTTDFSGFSYNEVTGGLLFQGSQFATLENKPANFAVNLDIQLI